MSRQEMRAQVQQVEDEIRRRLPIGSQISTRTLKDELARQVSLFPI
jgi:hypothetical protein